MQSLTKLARMFDGRPWAAQLYVTDNCNLDCHYCNEYDNDVPHPKLEDLKAWMRKIRDLGTVKLQFLGGEPLLHPDLPEIVRYAKELGFSRTGMSSNAFSLSRRLLRDLEDAGLDSLQISVDRMTPTRSTRKSLKTVLHKLDWFRESPISMTVTSVMFSDNLDEIGQVIVTCLERGVPVSARLVHDDLVHQRSLRGEADTQALIEFLQYQARLKKNGERIHQPWRILNYQLASLRGAPPNWTCVAGNKFFFVSARGKFWLCSQVRTDKHILDVTLEDLRSHEGPKSCQEGCGVYCQVSASFLINHPVRGVYDEVREWFSKRAASRRKARAERSGDPIEPPPDPVGTRRRSAHLNVVDSIAASTPAAERAAR